ncbi:MAG: NosD domain-containing protein [Acidobacteriota bacterium]
MRLNFLVPCPSLTVAALVAGFLLAGCLLAASPATANPPCGATLSGTTHLTANLHCTSGPYALRLNANAVLQLDGYALTGTVPVGVLIDGDNAVVRGFGSIEGFTTGISASGYHGVEVDSVAFSLLGTGVLLEDGKDGEVFGSTFSFITAAGVELRDASAADVLYHSIHGNTFFRINEGVRLCGTQVKYNQISTNTFFDGDYGVRAIHGANYNHILKNEHDGAAVAAVGLENVSNNLVEGNRMQDGARGVWILGEALPLTSPCDLSQVLPESWDNWVRTNTMLLNITGVQLGGASGFATTRDNTVTGNKIHDGSVGGDLRADSQNNDFFGNSFCNLSTGILDLGTGNITVPNPC